MVKRVNIYKVDSKPNDEGIDISLWKNASNIQLKNYKKSKLVDNYINRFKSEYPNPAISESIFNFPNYCYVLTEPCRKENTIQYHYLVAIPCGKEEKCLAPNKKKRWYNFCCKFFM